MKQLSAGFILLLIATCIQAQPMPVKLSKFKVQKTSTGVTAIWTTEIESNNDHFELQGSRDGLNFVTLGTMASHFSDGNSSAPSNYTLVISLKTQAGVSLFFILLTASVGISLYKRRMAFIPVILIMMTPVFPSCSKSNDASNTDKESYSFYRLKQVDKDATITYYSQTN